MPDEIDTAVYANDWETLVSYISLVPSMFGIRRFGVEALEMKLPCCGETRSYKHTYEIPTSDVGPCKCGNWFIRYREQSLRVVW